MICAHGSFQISLKLVAINCRIIFECPTSVKVSGEKKKKVENCVIMV